jgi:hypothetical protein
VSCESGNDDQLVNGAGLDGISLWFRSEEETMSFLRRWTEIGRKAFGEVDADAMQRTTISRVKPECRPNFVS